MNINRNSASYYWWKHLTLHHLHALYRTLYISWETREPRRCQGTKIQFAEQLFPGQLHQQLRLILSATLTTLVCVARFIIFALWHIFSSNYSSSAQSHFLYGKNFYKFLSVKWIMFKLVITVVIDLKIKATEKKL